MTAVAAAASVPSSFTSTKALCTTSEMNRPRRPVMPEKSAVAEGVHHAHRLQRLAQVELAAQLEARQHNLYFDWAQPLRPQRQVVHT